MAEPSSTPADRQDLHKLLDHIPPSDLPAPRKILRALADPVWQSILTAPLDDEMETPEERSEVEAARNETGPGTSHRGSFARVRSVSRFIWTEHARDQLAAPP